MYSPDFKRLHYKWKSHNNYQSFTAIQFQVRTNSSLFTHSSFFQAVLVLMYNTLLGFALAFKLNINESNALLGCYLCLDLWTTVCKLHLLTYILIPTGSPTSFPTDHDQCKTYRVIFFNLFLTRGVDPIYTQGFDP